MLSKGCGDQGARDLLRGGPEIECSDLGPRGRPTRLRIWKQFDVVQVVSPGLTLHHETVTRGSSIRLAAEAARAFLASAAFFGLAAAAIPLRRELVLILIPGRPLPLCRPLAAARRLGPLYGVPLAIAAGLALDSFYIPPTREFRRRRWQNWLVIAIYLLLGVLIGMLGTRSTATRRSIRAGSRPPRTGAGRTAAGGDPGGARRATGGRLRRRGRGGRNAPRPSTGRASCATWATTRSCS